MSKTTDVYVPANAESHKFFSNYKAGDIIFCGKPACQRLTAVNVLDLVDLNKQIKIATNKDDHGITYPHNIKPFHNMMHKDASASAVIPEPRDVMDFLSIWSMFGPIKLISPSDGMSASIDGVGSFYNIFRCKRVGDVCSLIIHPQRQTRKPPCEQEFCDMVISGHASSNPMPPNAHKLCDIGVCMGETPTATRDPTAFMRAKAAHRVSMYEAAPFDRRTMHELDLVEILISN